MRRSSLELPPPLALCLSQKIYWQGFSKRGPQTSQMYREKCDSLRSMSLCQPPATFNHVPPKPTSNISVSPSFCALATLHCSSCRAGLFAVSLPAAMAHRTSGWSALIPQSPFPERMHGQGQHSLTLKADCREVLHRLWVREAKFSCACSSVLELFQGRSVVPLHIFCYILGKYSFMLSIQLSVEKSPF